MSKLAFTTCRIHKMYGYIISILGYFFSTQKPPLGTIGEVNSTGKIFQHFPLESFVGICKISTYLTFNKDHKLSTRQKFQLFSLHSMMYELSLYFSLFCIEYFFNVIFVSKKNLEQGILTMFKSEL